MEDFGLMETTDRHR